MLGGFSDYIESSAIFGAGQKFTVQRWSRLTEWTNMGDYFSKDDAMMEIILLQQHTPEGRYRIVVIDIDTKVIFDTKKNNDLLNQQTNTLGIGGGIVT